MTASPEWLQNIERTTYSDEIFSKIGRLLYKATRFESYCRAASSSVLLKQNPEILNNNELFTTWLSELDNKWLDNHINNIKSFLTIAEIKGALTTAKNSRNHLAHALTLGIEHVFGKNTDENNFEKEIAKITKDIVTGEYFAILISCAWTKEIYPDISYIQKNIDWVLEA